MTVKIDFQVGGEGITICIPCSVPHELHIFFSLKFLRGVLSPVYE